MTTIEISEEKKKLAAALVEVIWKSPLYKDERIDIEIGCVKSDSLTPGYKDKVVGVEVTAKVV